MSIASKHAYRFGYLKSDKWQNVRLEALVREKAKCEICGEESISNDAHHIWYPPNVYDTTPDHLVILCRVCHDFVHVMLPECKTKDEDLGKSLWLKIKNSIIAWRIAKMPIFKDSSGIETVNPREFMDEWKKVKKNLLSRHAPNGMIAISRSELGTILSNLTRLIPHSKDVK